jgi:hypothetical protein
MYVQQSKQSQSGEMQDSKVRSIKTGACLFMLKMPWQVLVEVEVSHHRKQLCRQLLVLRDLLLHKNMTNVGHMITVGWVHSTHEYQHCTIGVSVFGSM